MGKGVKDRLFGGGRRGVVAVGVDVAYGAEGGGEHGGIEEEASTGDGFACTESRLAEYNVREKRPWICKGSGPRSRKKCLALIVAS